MTKKKTTIKKGMLVKATAVLEEADEATGSRTVPGRLYRVTHYSKGEVCIAELPSSPHKIQWVHNVPIEDSIFWQHFSVVVEMPVLYVDMVVRMHQKSYLLDLSVGSLAVVDQVTESVVTLGRCDAQGKRTGGEPLSPIPRVSFWEHFVLVIYSLAKVESDIGPCLSDLLQQARDKHKEVYQDIELANRQIKAVEETLKEVLGGGSVEVTTAMPYFAGTTNLLPALVYDGSIQHVVIYEKGRVPSIQRVLNTCCAEVRFFFAPYLPALVEAAIDLLEQQRLTRLRVMQAATAE